MKSAIFSIAITVFLSGCAATGDDYKVGVVPELSKHPVLGTLTTAERALLGPDANQNGVRDDIDQVIAMGEAGPKDQATTYAQYVTKAIIIGSRGATAQVDSLSPDFVCSSAKVGDAALVPMIANTAARRAALDSWRKLLADANSPVGKVLSRCS